MKKLVLLLAVAFSVSMFSCGGADKKAETDSVAADTAVVVAEEVAVVEVDTVAADTTVADSAAAAVVAE